MSALLAPYLVFTGRSVKRFLRAPEILVQTVAFPVLLLLTMLAAFGSAVEAFGDEVYAQGLVPVLVVSGLMFGSTGTATGFFGDLHSGFMDRIRSMPTPSAAPLVGTAIAEVIRALVAVAVLVGIGHAVGFRFSGGLVGVVGFVAIAALAGVSVVWVGLAMATVAKSPESLAPPLSALFLTMLFLSEGMVPLEAYPGWTQPIVRANPATSYVSALAALSTGDPATRPVFNSILWSIALVSVFGTIAITRVRKLSS